MRKGLSFIIALTLSFSAASFASADSLSDAQNKLNTVNDSINKKKEAVDNINRTQKSTEDDIRSLDSQMNDVSDKLSKINENINSVTSQVNKIQEEISGKQNKLDKENDLFKDRMRALYITGNTGYMEVILNSSSFADLISRVDNVAKIIEYDKNLLSNIKSEKNTLEIKGSELEKVKNQVVLLKQQATDQYSQLDSLSVKKKGYMEALKKDKASYEKMIAQEEQESKNITKMIKDMKSTIEQSKKKAEEDSKKNNGGSSTKSNGKFFCVTGTPYVITSGYGYRIHPVLKTKILHAGIDIGVPEGTPVYALADGVVIASESMSGYGNVVMISHGNIISVYAHNSSLVVKEGQTVKGGQLISYSGNTGLSTGPHLHFEIRNSDGNPIDPNSYYVK